MLNILKNLISSSGVSGREKSVSDKILTYIAPLCDKVWEDPMGNLIAYKRGGGIDRKKIMLCSNMDETGFMVTSVNENGNIKVAPVGEINYVSSAYGFVVSENGVRGVIVPENTAASTELKAGNVYIDIGVKDKKEAQKKVSVGDFFVCEPTVNKVGRKICGRPMDNRVGCAILISLAEKISESGCPNDIYFVFTTQEQVGMRGAKAAAYAIEPDCGLVIDVTCASEGAGGCVSGEGAAIKIKDRSVVCDRSVFERLMTLAKDNSVKYQCEISSKGSTDASALMISKAGVKAGAVSVPAKYMHSNVEMIDMNDCDACLNLVELFVMNY